MQQNRSFSQTLDHTHPGPLWQLLFSILDWKLKKPNFGVQTFPVKYKDKTRPNKVSMRYTRKCLSSLCMWKEMWIFTYQWGETALQISLAHCERKITCAQARSFWAEIKSLPTTEKKSLSEHAKGIPNEHGNDLKAVWYKAGFYSEKILINSYVSINAIWMCITKEFN